MFASNPWCSLPYRCITLISASIITQLSSSRVYLSLSLYSSFIRTSLVVDWEPTLLQYELIITWLHLQRLFSKKDYIHRYQELRHQCSFSGMGTQSNSRQRQEWILYWSIEHHMLHLKVMHPGSVSVLFKIFWASIICFCYYFYFWRLGFSYEVYY